MTSKSLPAAIVATALLGAAIAQAQSAPAHTPAKPSPYQGVSQPPSDPILTTDDQPQQTTVAPVPVSSVPSPAATPVVATPPEVSSNDEDDAFPPTPKASPRSSHDPDAGIVTYVPGPANALPEGTVFRVRMQQEIMASDTIPGTPFRAKLSQDLVHNGRVVVPVGSELLGKIAYASSGRRIGGPSLIHLVPSEFVLPDGTRYRVHAEVIDTAGSDTKASGEGNIASSGHGKRALVEIAAGGGGGALVGALGGPAGAAIGSAVGASVVGAHWLLAKQSAEVPEQSTVVFSLTDPMFISPIRK